MAGTLGGKPYSRALRATFPMTKESQNLFTPTKAHAEWAPTSSVVSSPSARAIASRRQAFPATAAS
eukprot:8774345-Pyramimonas_sp.AAC.1